MMVVGHSFVICDPFSQQSVWPLTFSSLEDRLESVFHRVEHVHTTRQTLLRNTLKGHENAHMKRSSGGLQQNRSYLTWIWRRKLMEEGRGRIVAIVRLSLSTRTKRLGSFHPQRGQGTVFITIYHSTCMRVDRRFHGSVLLPFFLFRFICWLLQIHV